MTKKKETMKTNTPTISVVIPTYNAEKFLAKCLEHLVHQTYRNLEIIVVDDGSTDNVANVYNMYAAADSRVKIVRQKNAGPATASNTGLDAATGEYVHFHDHDDYVNLDYFEKMANAAVLTDADILCSEVNQPSYNFPRFSAIEILVSMRDKILKTRANRLKPAWRYVYKKSFLEEHKLRFDPKIFGAQDLYFTWPAMVLAHTVATVPGAVYNVVDTDTALGKSSGTISSRNNTEYITKARANLQKFFCENGVDGLFAAPDLPIRSETLRMFNCKVFRRDIFHNKIRYYLFGINIATKRLY